MQPWAMMYAFNIIMRVGLGACHAMCCGHTNRQLYILRAQGVMLDIVCMISIVMEENLPVGILWTPWSDLFYALMFWFVFLLIIYCLFFCFM